MFFLGETSKRDAVRLALRDVAVCCPLGTRTEFGATSRTGPATNRGPPTARGLANPFTSSARYDARAPPPFSTTELPPAFRHRGERLQLRWRQRWRSATSPSPTRASTAARRPALRRSSRTSASPSTPANDAFSSAPTAQVTPTTRVSNLPSPPFLSAVSVLIGRGGGGGFVARAVGKTTILKILGGKHMVDPRPAADGALRANPQPAAWRQEAASLLARRRRQGPPLSWPGAAAAERRCRGLLPSSPCPLQGAGGAALPALLQAAAAGALSPPGAAQARWWRGSGAAGVATLLARSDLGVKEREGSAFHDTALTSSGGLCYLGGEVSWRFEKIDLPLFPSPVAISVLDM
ncbi:hypothetical protein HU200_016494 [Digitaria exilis]|uniref:Uncharacterized protein n=1 Tax=Digitaria exilis TaxID=1010633 RepID=A0A835KIJ6_9POAL|nr:hypothetical protein HU200_016494 [Digitaria exilis]